MLILRWMHAMDWIWMWCGIIWMIKSWGDQSMLFLSLQDLSISLKLWQYWMLSLLERQLLKLLISLWQGFTCCCWYCWGACCCWVCSWEWLLDPPIIDRTAWWATSEPAPKAIPLTRVLPNPENMPPLDCVCCWTGGCWAGMGRVAVVAVLEGDGDDALPRDEPPLEPLGITNNY